MDLDCIAINNPPRFFDQLMSGKRPILYDITQTKHLKDIKKDCDSIFRTVNRKKIIRPKWFGGEFIRNLLFLKFCIIL